MAWDGAALSLAFAFMNWYCAGICGKLVDENWQAAGRILLWMENEVVHREWDSKK